MDSAAIPNVAVTVLAELIATLQVDPDTLVHPLHEEKVEPTSGAAVSVTIVAGDVLDTAAVHPAVDPVAQETPSAVTVPRPVPDVLTVRSQVAGWKVAVTLFAPVMETVQLVPDTLVQPVHDLKMASAPGAATSVVLAPFATGSVQSPVDPVAQEMPFPVTVPFPDTAAVSRYVEGWNVAVTVLAPVIETVQLAPDALAHPSQDLRMEPASGVAVSTTLAPFATAALHPSGVAALHAIPSPSTAPPPDTFTVSG